MKPTLIARCALLAIALLLGACSDDVVLSDTTSASDSDTAGEDSDNGESSGEVVDAGASDIEEELTPAELEALEAEAAAALVIRKSFDKLVFDCGLDGDLGQCVQLREVLDAEAEAELIERCDIQDKVACDALSNTIVADLQVQCIYEDDAESCQTLDASWDWNTESNYGLGDSMTQAPLDALEADCLLGGVVECAELAARDAS